VPPAKLLRIIAIAASADTLYALDSNGDVWKFDGEAEEWTALNMMTAS
jgi:hypothetical protein